MKNIETVAVLAISKIIEDHPRAKFTLSALRDLLFETDQDFTYDEQTLFLDRCESLAVSAGMVSFHEEYAI
tara:strand:+ start:756 stop:968 length:213 start_codon:yes stop_codon:yes gene_type:complete